MAEKNILMQRKTATGYDSYYPKTKVENVAGAAKQADLDAHLADDAKHVIEIANYKLETSAVAISFDVPSYCNSFEITIDAVGATFTKVALLFGVTFNDDNGANYSHNGIGGGSAKTSIRTNNIVARDSSNPTISKMYISNIEDLEKTLIHYGQTVFDTTATAFQEGAGKWNNKINKISKITLTSYWAAIPGEAPGDLIPAGTKFRIVGVI